MRVCQKIRCVWLSVLLIILPLSLRYCYHNVYQTTGTWTVNPNAQNARIQTVFPGPPSGDNPVHTIIWFNHPMKTGGTSLSAWFEEWFGTSRVLPGSDESGRFSIDEFQVAIQKQSNRSAFWRTFAIAYGHTALPPSAVTDTIPPSLNVEFVPITLLRDPINWIASNWNEWMCEINKSIQLQTRAGVIPEGSCAVNLTTLASKKRNDCRNIVNRKCKRILKNHREGKPNPCEHPEHAITHHPSLATLNTHLLEVMLGANASAPDFDAGRVLSRLQWFGITERFDDSMCLLHWWLKAPISAELGSRRVKKCRPLDNMPTSSIQLIRQQTASDRVVFDAASTLLSERLESVRREVILRQQAGENMTAVSYVCPQLLSV